MKKILFLIIIILGVYYGYTCLTPKEKEKFLYEDILTNILDNKVNVDTFTIYGKYLNLKGVLPEDDGTYTLVLKNNEKEDLITTNIDSNRFSTSNYINDGINLEKLEEGNYILLLKNIEKEKYYNLINKTIYHDNKYYTMTKNNQNNLITFKEENYQNINYWTINIQKDNLPDDVYDIVIDPGHGGIDTGAGNGRYNESTFTLDYAKTLKNALEEKGLKVKLTRESDVQLEYYGKNSRTGIPYESHAKLMLSLHLNSSNSKIQKGVEIYQAYQDNNDYAKVLADNIVNIAKTVYSNNPQNKVINGVYMRVYTKENIEALAKEARRDGYEPYVLGNDETYYYFIRETGAIMTKAFSDGRNPKFKENIYRNLNQAVEAYLCELAYISQTDDLNNILNNKDGYIKALTKSVLSYAEINDDNEEVK